MEKAELILTNAIVLSMDSLFSIYEPGAVAIQGDHIVAVGTEEDILEKYQSESVHDCGGKVLMPGMVNTHTHVPMSLLRGLADDLRLDVWLMGYMMPVEREFVSPEFVRLGTKLACAELIKSGVTTFNDMYYFEDDIAEATAQAGMRAVVGQTVMKFPAPDASSFEVSLKLCRNLIEKWTGHPLIVPAIAPHAVYTCPPEVLTACVELAKEKDTIVHFHVSETQDEVQNLRDEHGIPVVPYIRKFGMLETRMIAAHCVFLDHGEIRSLRNAGVGIAHNPSSNLKLASGFAPVAEMIKLGCNVGIGTDGSGSNNDLDFIEEIRLASLIAKPIAEDPTALPARQVLEMATIMGAKAIHMGDSIGSLEPGKRADLILVDLNPLHNQPRFRRDPEGVYAQIIYASKSTDVTDVMVNGQWLMRDNILTTLDEEELIREANIVARKIDKFLRGREESVHSKLIAIGGVAEEESFEVQAKVAIDDRSKIIDALHEQGIKILRMRHYHQFDTYFAFEDEEQGVLRYREDEFINEKGKIENVRSRLTQIGERVDEKNGDIQNVLLSRTRYFAPATHSLRFYTEYFKPEKSIEIEKDRLRYLIEFEGTEFFVNLDTLAKPDLGKFIEIKSRTWSREDADNKTALIKKLFKQLGISTDLLVTDDYLQMAKNKLTETRKS
ncbi:MAG: amidohydrolase family protein [Chloroflexi bacterium]|jgi:5-methylthioadenosine/S-adenosylhomocysteine deaminase|nr:amidohydrolase family protein [Chloroflexota bacterium]